MSQLVRLIRSLESESRRWGKIESQLFTEPAIAPIAFSNDGRGSEPYQATFRIKMQEPLLGPGTEREFTITVTETETRRS